MDDETGGVSNSGQRKHHCTNGVGRGLAWKVRAALAALAIIILALLSASRTPVSAISDDWEIAYTKYEIGFVKPWLIVVDTTHVVGAPPEYFFSGDRRDASIGYWSLLAHGLGAIAVLLISLRGVGGRSMLLAAGGLMLGIPTGIFAWKIMMLQHGTIHPAFDGVGLIAFIPMSLAFAAIVVKESAQVRQVVILALMGACSFVIGYVWMEEWASPYGEQLLDALIAPIWAVIVPIVVVFATLLFRGLLKSVVPLLRTKGVPPHG